MPPRLSHLSHDPLKIRSYIILKMRSGTLGRILTLTIFLFCVPSAHAHHNASSNRLNGPQLRSSQLSLDTRKKLHINLGYSITLFDRVLSKSQVDNRFDLGSAIIQKLEIGVGYTFATNTQLNLTIPLGFIYLDQPTEPNTTSLDLGDASFSIGQLLKIMTNLSFGLQVGIAVPLGTYESDLLLSDSTIEGANDGTFNLTSSSSQATISSGAVSLYGVLSSHWDMFSNLSWRLSTSYRTYISETPDEIKWGDDIQITSIHSTKDFLLPFNLLLGGSYIYHSVDQLPNISNTEEIKAGERHSFNIILGAQKKLSSKLHCIMAAHVPIWQQVDQIQLVESFSANISCSYN